MTDSTNFPIQPTPFANIARFLLEGGMSVEEVLDQHSEHLAKVLSALAESWVRTDLPLNNAIVTGINIAADRINPATNR